MEDDVLKSLPTYTYAEFVKAVEALKAEGLSAADIEKGLKAYLGIVDVPSPVKVRGRYKVVQGRLAKACIDTVDGKIIERGEAVYRWQKNGKTKHSKSLPPGGYVA